MLIKKGSCYQSKKSVHKKRGEVCQINTTLHMFKVISYLMCSSITFHNGHFVLSFSFSHEGTPHTPMLIWGFTTNLEEAIVEHQPKVHCS